MTDTPIGMGFEADPSAAARGTAGTFFDAAIVLSVGAFLVFLLHFIA